MPALDNSAICPACEAGDHEHSWITERDYRCACPCHARPAVRELPRGMGRSLLDYELLGFVLATRRAA